MASDTRTSRSRRDQRARWRLALVLGAVVAALSRPAAAQPPPRPRAGPAELATAQDDFLVWQAPSGCSTAAAIRERVSDLLGEPELDRERVRRVEGHVTETRDGWALRLILVDALGQRERQLAAPHCADLAEAAAVAISLAFEAARARERDEQTPLPVAATEAPVVAPRSEPEPPAPDAALAAPSAAPEQAGARTLEPELGAELWIDGNALPAPAAGGSVLGALRLGDLRLGAFAAWLPGVERSVGPGQNVSFSLLLGGVRGCYALGHGFVDTALCLGFEAGRLSARGSGLLSAGRAHDLWLAPQLGLELSTALSAHLALHLRADGFAPLLRQGYAVNETDDVHHVTSLGGRAVLGLRVAL